LSFGNSFFLFALIRHVRKKHYICNKGESESTTS
jgi:hypothetical protein